MRVLDRLYDLADTCGAETPKATVERVLRSLGTPQPAHVSLLARMNGAAFLGGHYRLFGTAPTALDIVAWNDRQLWRFAWDWPEEFYAFGATSLGDQFVAHRELSLISMITVSGEYVRIADSLEGFLEWFERQLREPSEDVAAARRRFPEVPLDKLVAQAPPKLLTGRTTPDGMRLMSAPMAMTIAGDVVTQYQDPRNEGRRVVRFESYADDQQNLRLRLVFAD